MDVQSKPNVWEEMLLQFFSVRIEMLLLGRGRISLLWASLHSPMASILGFWSCEKKWNPVQRREIKLLKGLETRSCEKWWRNLGSLTGRRQGSGAP